MVFNFPLPRPAVDGSCRATSNVVLKGSCRWSRHVLFSLFARPSSHDGGRAQPSCLVPDASLWARSIVYRSALERSSHPSAWRFLPTVVVHARLWPWHLVDFRWVISDAHSDSRARPHRCKVLVRHQAWLPIIVVLLLHLPRRHRKGWPWRRFRPRVIGRTGHCFVNDVHACLACNVPAAQVRFDEHLVGARPGHVLLFFF